MQFFRRVWKNEAGLGLIEMAIVLIVIGVFLTGLVPKGRKMIADTKRMKTVGEISQYAKLLSDFMKNTGLSSAELLTNKNTWTTILSKKSESLEGESGNNSTNDHSPGLSNGGFLFIEDKDGICYLCLGKKGKKAFLTYHEASLLKEQLGDGVEIVTMDGKSIDSKLDQEEGAFCLRIPVD